MKLVCINCPRGCHLNVEKVDGKIIVDVIINVVYGCNIMDVAKNVQSAVSSAVESMVGIHPDAVNVNICGIVRK